MKRGERRTNMAFRVGTPPKTRVKDLPPRWCEAPGVGNFRDLGGWTGLDGDRIDRLMLVMAAWSRAFPQGRNAQGG